MTIRRARPFGAMLLATLAALAAAGGPAAATSSATTSSPPATDSEYGEARILWLLNEERRIRGLPPVRRHAGADHIAQYSANVQAYYGRLGHNPNLARDVNERVTTAWTYAGENVGCGFDADDLHGMWMRSSGHVANALRRGSDTVGVGASYARGCLWATVVFVDT